MRPSKEARKYQITWNRNGPLTLLPRTHLMTLAGGNVIPAAPILAVKKSPPFPFSVPCPLSIPFPGASPERSISSK